MNQKTEEFGWWIKIVTDKPIYIYYFGVNLAKVIRSAGSEILPLSVLETIKFVFER